MSSPTPLSGKVKVSSAIQIASSTPVCLAGKAAVAVVDGVHWDGKLPQGTLREMTSIERVLHPTAYGFYNPKTDEVASKPWFGTKLTFVHEIGHFLDYKGIDTPFISAAARSPSMQQWRDAVARSSPVHFLTGLSIGNVVRVEIGGVVYQMKIDHEDIKHIDYLLKWHELWARCYLQYVVLKSTDKDIKRRFIHVSREPDIKLFKEVWPWSEFKKTIAPEIDQIFATLGWI